MHNPENVDKQYYLELMKYRRKKQMKAAPKVIKKTLARWAQDRYYRRKTQDGTFRRITIYVRDEHRDMIRELEVQLKNLYINAKNNLTS